MLKFITPAYTCIYNSQDFYCAIGKTLLVFITGADDKELEGVAVWQCAIH